MSQLATQNPIPLFFQTAPEDRLFTIVVTCASGIEALLFDELSDLIAQQKIVSNEEYFLEQASACVFVQGDLSLAYRFSLWSRLGEQVLITLAQVKLIPGSQELAREKLYQAANAFPWEKIISFQQTFKIEVNGKQTIFNDSRFAALICKDAIVDRFRENYDKRPSIDKENADLHLHLFVQEELFTLSISFSGERLHKRAYRQQTVEAPIKETLAAALLRQVDWHKNFSEMDYFVDPCCGSGTLPIEALMMAADIAPGLFRKEFGFEKLAFHQPLLWENILLEARQRKENGLQALKVLDLKIRAYDSEISAISACKANLGVLGLESFVHVEKRALFNLSGKKLMASLDIARNAAESQDTNSEIKQKGLLLSNPPYGERLQEADELKYLYQFLGERLQQDFEFWQVGIICNQVELLDALRLSDYQQQRFFNGNLACLFRYTRIPKLRNTDAYCNYFLNCVENKSTQADLVENIPQDLQNRIYKNLKKLRAWIVSNEISCFRLYDADLPEFNAAVDCYQYKDKVWLMVAEYAPPKTVNEDIAKERFSLLLASLRKIFSLQREQIYIKTRQRQKGSSQYHSKDHAKQVENRKSTKLLPVCEDQLNFLLNPVDYLDTGLFLDHRLVRKMIRHEAKGKRFLNLFAYTASASVYAAAGGARSTLSLDLSENYLKWARKNLLANGFSLENHKTEKTDIIAWLESSKAQFDLIFLDPPTFSNSKKKNLIFDLQQDHKKLIELSMARLDKAGKLIFSNNYRRFEMDPSLSQHFQITEITEKTISPDFSRARVPHRSWIITYPE